MAKRILGFLLSLLVMAGFYVFSVMMQGEDSRQQDDLHPRQQAAGLQRITPLEGGDAAALAQAFGAPFPLPNGLVSGRVDNGSHQAAITRLLRLTGSQAQVQGVRPASAAPAIFPRDAAFLASRHTLLGYELLEAKQGGHTLYALITDQAAFLITPTGSDGPGEFHLQETK